MRKILLPALLVGCAVTTVLGQNMPIGQWRAHMPYNEAVAAATDGVTLYAASRYSFFTYNTAQDEISTYSKVEGMSDVGISLVGYDAHSGSSIIVYRNANIDLFRDETFFNIPDLKLKTIAGAKNVNHIHVEADAAYLSTSFGVVVLNLDKKETKETYTFMQNDQTIEVFSFTSAGDHFYAATADGLYRAKKSSINLQDFAAWQKVDARTSLRKLLAFNNQLVAGSTDSVFALSADSLRFVLSTNRIIRNIDATEQELWISEENPVALPGMVRKLDSDLSLTDSVVVWGKPVGVLTLADGAIWIIDEQNGMGKKNGNDVTYLKPGGPASASAFDIMPYNGEVWVAHGSYSDAFNYQKNPAGISRYQNGEWKIYNGTTEPKLQDATDFVVLARDPADGTVYAGAFRSGIFIVKPDGTTQLLKDNTGFLEPAIPDPSAYFIGGLAFDQNNVLWVVQGGALHELVAKTPEGNWIPMRGAASGIISAAIIVDDYNQKWYLTPYSGGGVAVYDDKGTPDNISDDAYIRVSTSEVDNTAYSIAKDRTGSIWVGTAKGIGIFHCPGEILEGTCKIDRPIVQYDQFAGYLFQNEKVNTIAVDGANRKWIGTNNGVWLISPDGDKIIHRFTSENSPLPSNIVQKISVDPITGDVYMGSSDGLVSFRGTATEGGETNQTVITFPNPIPSGYSGTIAIRGVSENADVRITDISGQLVYRTRALGGQAVWNGLDYTGRRPQSGVYLIFVTNRDGSQTHAGKMVFME